MTLDFAVVVRPSSAMKMIANLQDRWNRRKFERSFNEAAAAAYTRHETTLPPPTERYVVRRLSDEQLVWWLARDPKGEARIVLEQELRRRDAWATPSGWALRVSIASLLVAAAALALSLFVALR